MREHALGADTRGATRSRRGLAREKTAGGQRAHAARRRMTRASGRGGASAGFRVISPIARGCGVGCYRRSWGSVCGRITRDGRKLGAPRSPRELSRRGGSRQAPPATPPGGWSRLRGIAPTIGEVAGPILIRAAGGHIRRPVALRAVTVACDLGSPRPGRGRRFARGLHRPAQDPPADPRSAHAGADPPGLAGSAHRAAERRRSVRS